MTVADTKRFVVNRGAKWMDRHRGATLAYLAASSSFETAGQLIRACMQVESHAASHACMVNPGSSTR
jgi:hypothetical protein